MVQLAACDALAHVLDGMDGPSPGLPCSTLVTAIRATHATLDSRHWRVACALARCASRCGRCSTLVTHWPHRVCRVYSGDPTLERLTAPTMQQLQGGMGCVAVQDAAHTAAMLLRHLRCALAWRHALGVTPCTQESQQSGGMVLPAGA